MITPKKSVKDKALQELRAVWKEVHAKNKGVSEEEVVRTKESLELSWIAPLLHYMRYSIVQAKAQYS